MVCTFTPGPGSLDPEIDGEVGAIGYEVAYSIRNPTNQTYRTLKATVSRRLRDAVALSIEINKVKSTRVHFCWANDATVDPDRNHAPRLLVWVYE